MIENDTIKVEDRTIETLAELFAARMAGSHELEQAFALVVKEKRLTEVLNKDFQYDYFPIHVSYDIAMDVLDRTAEMLGKLVKEKIANTTSGTHGG